MAGAHWTISFRRTLVENHCGTVLLKDDLYSVLNQIRSFYVTSYPIQKETLDTVTNIASALPNLYILMVLK